MKHDKRPPRLDLNPSSADRWTTCTASPGFILANWDKVPQDTSTRFSDEGTTAHEVAAAYLQDREPRESECPTPIDEDMRWHGWNYMEFVAGLRQPGSTLLVEQKLPLWYMPERNAIVDAAVINPQSLHIVDFKYGEGVAVHPEQNRQAVIYAKSVIASRKMILRADVPVSIHIYQPRGRNSGDSPSHTWETTWGEIETVANGIKSRADMIIVGSSGVDFAPSEKACQWCPAKGFCAARQAALTGDIEALAVISEDAPSLPAPGTVSVEQLAAILKHKKELVRWLDDAEGYALTHMKGGGRIPGFKLVTSRGGNRYWSDPKKAAELLLENTVLKKSEVIEEKVIGPAAAEKLLGKNKFSVELTNLITKPEGQPMIATEDDPRESCLADARGEFEKLSQ